jgi:two-component system phosphate regulon sensor histidine kinase PhoR
LSISVGLLINSLIKLKNLNKLCFNYLAALIPSIMANLNDDINLLIELNDELENYFSNTIIPQLFVDAKLILRKFTPPSMKAFKLEQNDIGRSFADVKDNFRYPTIIENIQHVIRSGQILEKEIQTTDLRWYQMNILPYHVKKENKTNGVIITFIDITARITDLKEQEKMIAEHELLLDTISHDIKNPLTALGMTVQLLSRVPEKGMDHFPQLLGNVKSSLNKINEIIYDLVQARWVKHRYQAQEELLDLQNIIEDVRLALAPQIQESEVSFTYKIEAFEVTFARRKLRSVIYNLVNNAIKYCSSDRKPEICIKSYIELDYFVISVSDNGIGINADSLDSVFLKYRRANSSTEGNGIGLFLVKSILENSGGKVIVESELGIGSTFKVFLPMSIYQVR